MVSKSWMEKQKLSHHCLQHLTRPARCHGDSVSASVSARQDELPSSWIRQEESNSAYSADNEKICHSLILAAKSMPSECSHTCDDRYLNMLWRAALLCGSVGTGIPINSVCPGGAWYERNPTTVTAKARAATRPLREVEMAISQALRSRQKKTQRSDFRGLPHAGPPSRGKKMNAKMNPMNMMNPAMMQAMQFMPGPRGGEMVQQPTFDDEEVVSDAGKDWARGLGNHKVRAKFSQPLVLCLGRTEHSFPAGFYGECTCWDDGV